MQEALTHTKLPLRYWVGASGFGAFTVIFGSVLLYFSLPFILSENRTGSGNDELPIVLSIFSSVIILAGIYVSTGYLWRLYRAQWVLNRIEPEMMQMQLASVFVRSTGDDHSPSRAVFAALKPGEGSRVNNPFSNVPIWVAKIPREYEGRTDIPVAVYFDPNPAGGLVIKDGHTLLLSTPFYTRPRLLPEEDDQPQTRLDIRQEIRKYSSRSSLYVISVLIVTTLILMNAYLAKEKQWNVHASVLDNIDALLWMIVLSFLSVGLSVHLLYATIVKLLLAREALTALPSYQMQPGRIHFAIGVDQTDNCRVEPISETAEKHPYHTLHLRTLSYVFPITREALQGTLVNTYLVRGKANLVLIQTADRVYFARFN